MALSFDLPFEFAPYRLSGTVYGVLMNHRAALAALGDAAHQPPYKAPPKAPVLYVKPRNTLVAPGAPLRIDDPAGELEVGAALGIVIGTHRLPCRRKRGDGLRRRLRDRRRLQPAARLATSARRSASRRATARARSAPKVTARADIAESRCARRPRPGRRPAGACRRHRRHRPRRRPAAEPTSASS